MTPTIYNILWDLRIGQSVDEGVEIVLIDPDDARIYEGGDWREGIFRPAHVK